ncbi:MAG: DEAD/DEAH box helicase, partial [Oscillospiraceae bacterium]
MKELIDSVLTRWLEIEYYAIANKTKFISYSAEADYELIMDSIRCLDYITAMEKGRHQNYVITVIALMWEHIDKTKYDIKNFVLKILTRIGYPTSAIIIDNEFTESGDKFFRPNSILDMLTLTLEQQRNEVIINKHSFLLTDFQKEIWDAMDTSSLIGISAPTSAGKSFVLLLKTISRLVADEFDIVYVVPTLSLLNQVTEDYNKMLKKLDITNCKIVNSFIPDNKEDSSTIYILTQEKALGAFSNEETAFAKKLILVVDEIQNIERIHHSNDLRAKILYDTLIEFRQKDNIEQVIISGPRIDDIDNLGEKIFGDATLELRTDISPVLNLTYSIKKIQNKYYLKQYCALRSGAFSREINDTTYIAGYGKKHYTDEYKKYLKTFIKNIGSGDQNIIFAPTSNTAKDIAIAISDDIIDTKGPLEDLINYYADTINANYAMCTT